MQTCSLEVVNPTSEGHVLLVFFDDATEKGSMQLHRDGCGPWRTGHRVGIVSLLRDSQREIPKQQLLTFKSCNMDNLFTYSVVERKNPHDSFATSKYYAQAQARGVAGIRTISKRIQDMCTVTRADIMAVLVALETTVSDCLANGEIVRLGDLGSLQVSLSSKGTTTAENFHPNNINASRILFRPGQTLARMQHELKFQRVPKRSTKVTEETEEVPEREPEKEEQGLGA